jgi:hypothetical protein
MQTAVLDAIEDPSLRLYVVWVPILPADQGPAAQNACSLAPDKRASHFWDAEGTLPTTFGRVLNLASGCPAWDVYLAYPPGIRWDDEPPRPSYWQHQLGAVAAAPQLDGETFAAHVRLTLANQPGDGVERRRSGSLDPDGFAGV